MEHGESVRAELCASETVGGRANPTWGPPWVAGLLQDATEAELEEMWCLGTENVCGYRSDVRGDAARQLIHAIEDELRHRASASMLLLENIEAALRQQRPHLLCVA